MAPERADGDVDTSAVKRFGGNARIGWGMFRLQRHGEAAALDETLRLVARMGDLKGIVMKVGQVMSYTDFALPEPARDALASLQTSSPPMAWDVVVSILEEEFGADAATLIHGLDRKPVASASIGQVHRGRIDGREVAVKVQYPGIAEAIRADFSATRLAPAIAQIVFPGSRGIQGLLAEARQRILDECDYAAEAAYQDAFATAWKDHATIVIPETLPGWCSRRVLTTAWIDGIRQDAWLAQDPTSAERDRAAEALWDFYIGSLLRHGIYNGDPHPGNQLYLADGRVAILDHGCARRFGPDQVRALAKLVLAVHDGSDGALDAAMQEAGIGAGAGDLATARRLVRAFFRPLADPGEASEARMDLKEVMAAKRRMMRLRLPPEYLFLLRIRFGLAALLGRIQGRVPWAAKEQEAAREAIKRSSGPDPASASPER